MKNQNALVKLEMSSSMPILQRMDRLDRLVTMIDFSLLAVFNDHFSVQLQLASYPTMHSYYIFDDAAAVSGRETLLVIQAFF